MSLSFHLNGVSLYERYDEMRSDQISFDLKRIRSYHNIRRCSLRFVYIFSTRHDDTEDRFHHHYQLNTKLTEKKEKLEEMKSSFALLLDFQMANENYVGVIVRVFVRSFRSCNRSNPFPAFSFLLFVCESMSDNKPVRRLEARFLVCSRDAGAIIGKRGSNIQSLRQKHKVTIQVPDCDVGQEENSVR